MAHKDLSFLVRGQTCGPWWVLTTGLSGKSLYFIFSLCRSTLIQVERHLRNSGLRYALQRSYMFWWVFWEVALGQPTDHPLLLPQALLWAMDPARGIQLGLLPLTSVFCACRGWTDSFKFSHSWAVAAPALKPQLSSVAQLCPTLRTHGLQCARLPCPSPTPKACSNSCHRVGDAIQPSHPRSSPSPPSFNLSQRQDLFKWVSSSYWNLGHLL